MQTVLKFHTEPIAGGERSWLLSDDGLRVAVDGVSLEAQFQCSSGYLVITSDDIPYEEGLHFYLLGGGGEVLDELSLGQINHSGILRNVVPHADDRLEFSFFGSERWHLTVLDKPVFRLPGLLSSVRRKRWLGQHLLNLEKKTNKG